ncbi:TetR/AcrR family transcriptional regulator [Litorilituus lipolyticus]|uniref:TetR/AcrR family transcriptional regulator n=1 Tax=Litorilituus lipolyticus TaxID=2491017 RepID=A0A502KYX1_9GAMM|nr:TetR/AcrR family transcriptional regulator [Litorilituus lipolyticus]TPH15719.1 TetR/AcrR family transcriptional regulator [Litorilituus lipolyticus]
MGRPSLAALRVEEILDALEACIIEKGIQGASLESIADKAGFKRSILRHYIGNRDDIICALSVRWSEFYARQWLELLTWLPEVNRAESFIETIFNVESKEEVNKTIIGEALFSEAKRLKPIKRDQEKIMADFIKHFSDVLVSDYPTSDANSIELVSHGVYANYLLAESFLPLKLVDKIEKIKQSSKLLCTVLLCK